MVRDYALFGLISPGSLEEEVQTFPEKITSLIKEGGGVLINIAKPIKKNLAKPIKGREQAYFFSLTFKFPQEKLFDLENKLRAESKIIRFLVLKQKREKVEISRKRISRPKVELEKIEEKLKELLNE